MYIYVYIYTSSVVFIPARIDTIVVSLTVLPTYDFHMFTAIIVNYFFNVNLEKDTKIQKVRIRITKTLNDVQIVNINHVLKVNF